MTETVAPYPLAWPETLPRSTWKAKSQFRTQLTGAMKNVHDSLRLFGSESGKAVSDIVLSSNAVLGDMSPADAGVAVWFVWEGERRCIAVDGYPTVQENLQAIHHVLEARRTEMRHAGIVMVRAAFKGFTAALPAPDRRHWSAVLGVPRDADEAAVRSAYKVRAREYGERKDEASLRELNIARDAAIAEVGKR